MLGVSYVIDPRAQGSITLSSGRPIPKKDMLFVLESALHANNLNMVRDASGYKIVPAADSAVGAVDAGGQSTSSPGTGSPLFPCNTCQGRRWQNFSRVSPPALAPSGRIRRASSSMVVGTGSERQTALETVRSFDVDWLQGQSVGMYPVQNSTPEPIAEELEKIMDTGELGLGHGLVKFQAVNRLNSILVVASKPELLRAAARWISRLDEPSAASASVKVYKVRYGDAKQIAEMLSQIFGSGGGAALPATNEIAPGSGAKALTTVDRLTGGKPAGGDPGHGAAQMHRRGAPPRNTAPAPSRRSMQNSARLASARAGQEVRNSRTFGLPPTPSTIRS